jgi:hypothetical protein
MINIKNFFLKKDYLLTTIICLLISSVGFLTKNGVTRNIAFALVFTIFDLSYWHL